MARLSGLASEHHPVGPGDAPRRKRARKSQTPSVDLTQANKRPASPTPEPSQSKRKRVQIDDHEQITRELEESILRSQNDDHDVGSGDQTRASRRHSEPAVSAPGEEDDSQNTPPPPTQPLPGLTPHLDRLGAQRGRPSNARRARMSMPAQLRVEPVDENNGDRELQFAPLTAVLDGRTRRRLRRSHLSQEVNEIEEHNKEEKKLRQAYAELRRQLRQKDQVITDLEYQLEARRLGDIDMTDDRAEELQEQLAQAKKEIVELRASSVYTGDSREQSAFESTMDAIDDDDEPLMLVDPEDLGVQDDMDAEPLPNGEYASRALALSSQVTVDSLATMTQTSYDVLAEASQSDPTSVPDKISDKAVKRYETEIERLTQQLADSQAALRIVAIELQNLHVIPPGASSDVIITKLRHGFEALREELENLLPNRTVGLTNSELLRKIPEIFEDILEELREKVLLSEQYYRNEKMLRTQYEKVIDLLSSSEDRNADLEKEANELKDSNKEKQGRIAELEERVTTITTVADDQEGQINQKDAEIYGLRDEIEDKQTALERLRGSLETYRNDLNTVSETATRLEVEHKEAIADMEQAHAEVVQALEDQLGAEAEAREAAEGDAAQKSEYIDELVGRIDRLEGDVNAITDEMDQLRERLAAETHVRETAEGERDDLATMTYEQANAIENLEEQLQDLQSQLAESRTNLAVERTQREQTEASLDTANEGIADLETRVHDAGIQANELRSKLFQVQQDKELAIAVLEEEAQARDAEHQALLDAETERRQDTEQQVADLEAQKTQLEKQIADLSDTITQMTNHRVELEHDRDERIASLKAQLADLAQKFAALENNSTSEMTTMRANITDLTNQIQAQEAEIKRIKGEAAETERGLRDEVAVNTQDIADLERDLSTFRAENEKLVTENKSLANRVEDEAQELLNIMDAHAQESDALRSVINTQEDAIRTLQSTAAQRATEHEEQLAEKTREIEELRLVGDTRVEVIVTLESQIEDLKERFREQEEDTRNTIDTLIESQRQLQQQNEQLAAALKKRNAEALKAVQEMKVMGVEVKTRGVDLHKVANGKVTKVSERVKVGKKGARKKVTKRQWDSGFGVDENIENDIDEVDAEEAVVG